MKPIDEKRLEDLGKAASIGTKACVKFLEDPNADARTYQQAKNGAEMVSSWVKLLAIENARVALQLSIDNGTPHKSMHAI